MEEVQKNARTLYRLFIAVCALMIAAGVDKILTVPEGCYAELEALEALDLKEYQDEHLANWPGHGRLRKRGDEPSDVEKYVGRVWSSALENVENVDVYVPRAMYGVERLTLEKLRSGAKVGELHDLLVRNEGAHELKYGSSSLVPPGPPFTTLVESLSPGQWDNLEVIYQAEPAQQLTTSSPSGGVKTWRASARIAATVSSAAFAPLITGDEISFELQSTGKFAAGSLIQDWLRAKKPQLWESLTAPVGREDPRTVRLLPHLSRFWSEVHDKAPAEARQHFVDKQITSRQMVALLGVAVDMALLTIFGPLACIGLLLYLISDLSWITRSSPALKADLVVWTPLDGRPRAVALPTTLTLLCGLPLVALGLVWRRSFTAFGESRTDGLGETVGDFLREGSNWFGALSSLAFVVVAVLAAASLWRARAIT